jgi:hypothetical protein
VFGLSTGRLRAQPTSLPEFLARESQFGNLVGSTLQLEGRASTLTGTELRMKGTNLKFVLETEQERPRSLPYVQMTGRLERDGRDFRFLVTALKDYKPELEVVRERLRMADTSLPETYYQLAQWCVDRGKFYGDESLSMEAARLRSLGVQTAQRKTRTDDPSAWLALADQAAAWGLDPRLHMELLHGASRADLASETKSRQPAFAAALNKIKARFPGADQPLAEIPQPLQEMYAARPDASYAQADDEQRVVLQRLLFLEAAIRLAAQDARSDGSNGYAVAAVLERLAPERSDLVRMYREAELQFLESQVAKLERAAVLELRNKLREAGQSERATRIVRTWIEQQLSRRPKGPGTEVDRAELEYEMNGDLDRALALVASAMALDPLAPGGAELLALMGYGWHQGKTVRTELIPPKPPDPVVLAIQQGRILDGMTDQQVRASLGGAPESIVRLATQGRVLEFWHYPGQRLTIEFRATTQKPQLTVARIVETTQGNAAARSADR